MEQTKICEIHGLPVSDYGTCNDCEELLDAESTAQTAEEIFARRLGIPRDE